jgi:hypothetical protein
MDLETAISVFTWKFDKNSNGQGRWLMPIILPTAEAFIGRVAVQGQPSQKSARPPSQ